MRKIDAKGVYYRQLNEEVRAAICEGEKNIHLINVNGQRYIGDGIKAKTKITIDGVPGNDLAAFMAGPTIIVNSNAQDGIANTMDDGKVVVRGMAGDVLGYGMRGGKLYVKGDVGYRVGIHMKSYGEKEPVIIAGGCAGDFFGEYMAGGILILLGMDSSNRKIVGSYVGTGMHGGAIYLPEGKYEKHQLGAEVGEKDIDDEDKEKLDKLLEEYAEDVQLDYKKIRSIKLKKLYPKSHRPYGKLYAY